MPTSYHQLKLRLWWILPDGREGHDEFLDAYRTFFSEQTPLVDVDATFSFSEVYRKAVKNLHEEVIYHLDCTIEWPGVVWFGPSTKYLQLGRAWCSAGRDKAHGKALFQWLVPSPLDAFQLATHPFDRDHQLFSSSIIRDHRDYWVNAAFHHDQRMLHIDLHLNHREACGGRVTEYRFIVPYLNILKLVLLYYAWHAAGVDQREGRLVEIFLHLKIPAMLMGEVINDIPSLGLAAQRLLHRCAGSGTLPSAATDRWAVRTASLCGGLFLKLVLRGPLPRET
ncbi:hypothetical protein MTO96_038194 [Rhipicephalus appendiculatus]